MVIGVGWFVGCLAAATLGGAASAASSGTVGAPGAGGVTESSGPSSPATATTLATTTPASTTSTTTSTTSSTTSTTTTTTTRPPVRTAVTLPPPLPIPGPSAPRRATGAVLDPNGLAARVASAARPLAASLGVTLGKVTCPVGVADSARPGTIAQCVALFDGVPVPYLVQIGRIRGELGIRPALVVVRTAAAVASVRAAGGSAPISCGRTKVVVAPPGGRIRCTAGSGARARTYLVPVPDWSADVGRAIQA